MSQRIGYFDIARGIGILLVVLGHNDFGVISPFLDQLIYSFHVPLFFFLSGYFLNAAVPFTEFLRKRFHAILKPYLFTIFLIYFTSVSFEKMGFQTALGRIVKALYGSTNYIDWGQLWFLPNLFVVSLYAYAFIALAGRLRSRRVAWGMLGATLVLSILTLQTFYPFSVSILGKEYELYGLPFSMDVVLLSGFFFLLGSQVRQVSSGRTFESILLLAGAALGLIALNVLFPARVDIALRVYDSLLVNTAEAMLGIFVVLGLARQMDLRSPQLAALFQYFGNISLILLIFHLPIQAFWGQKVLAVTGHFPLSILVGFLMGVLGPVLIYEIFIRFNPVASYWFGRKAESPANKELPLNEERAADAPRTSIVDVKEP
jgi:fucose 4-O-acetylase-like acetyltransferase